MKVCCIGSTLEADLAMDAGADALGLAAAVKELGGTGRVHDWGISRRIRDAVGLPVFLAGGLRSTNVGGAIDAVEPYGVDVCSGVRTGGALDAAVLRDFMRAARGESKRALDG